ncbi:hypothetical protein FZM91_02885 [Enterococcus faecium]|nr:hypothetical protein CDL00_05325 [Enterococcus faecium]AVL45019.1 hypothetical protein CEQ01_06940 [Enterococcus faecium]EGP5086554.1 hypothetical protein [Enterococcus faecium]EGP5091269.1 hypothetical protein [Enterococcus faecium]EGP5102304.1 hypothetical protein [Enterococcus faecium]
MRGKRVTSTNGFISLIIANNRTKKQTRLFLAGISFLKELKREKMIFFIKEFLSFSLEKISVTMENRAKKNQSFSLYIILPIYRNC